MIRSGRSIIRDQTLKKDRAMLSRGKIWATILGTTPILIVLLCTFWDWRLFGGRHVVYGYVWFAVGGVASVFNFYISFLRHRIYCWRYGKDAEYQWNSGAPMIGFASVVGLALIPRSLWLSVLAFVLLAADTGGIQWFAIQAWKHDLT